MRYTRNGTREQDAAGGRIPAWQANGPGRAGAGAPSRPLGLAAGEDPAGPGRVDHHRAGLGLGARFWDAVRGRRSRVRSRRGLAGAPVRGWRRCSSRPGAWWRSWPSRRWPAGSAPASCRWLLLPCAAVAVSHLRVLSRRYVPCRTVAWTQLWALPPGMLAWWLAPGRLVISYAIAWALGLIVIGWRIGKSQQEARALSRQQGRSGALAAPHRPGGAAMAARPGRPLGRVECPPGPARRGVAGGADGRRVGAPGGRRAGP